MASKRLPLADDTSLLLAKKQQKKLLKHKLTLLDLYYSKKTHTLALEQVTFNLASRYEALLELLRGEVQIKTLAIWGCNASS